MKASLSNYRQSPRKTRLVTDLIKGKSVKDALLALSYANKKAAAPVKKLLESAIANAKKLGQNPDALMIKNITVDKGIVFTRFMPRARGSASPIRRRNSHIKVELAALLPKAEKPKRAKKATAQA